MNLRQVYYKLLLSKYEVHITLYYRPHPANLCPEVKWYQIPPVLLTGKLLGDVNRS